MEMACCRPFEGQEGPYRPLGGPREVPQEPLEVPVYGFWSAGVPGSQVQGV